MQLAKIDMLKSKATAALLLLLFTCTAMTSAAPYQELAPRAGHVPVYIRVGNTPLSEIHPGLAEAFREFESASLLLENNDEVKVKPVGTANAAKDNIEPQAVATTTPSTAADDEKAASKPTAPTLTTTTAESDIASFDVVKGDGDDSNSNNKAAAESNAIASESTHDGQAASEEKEKAGSA